MASILPWVGLRTSRPQLGIHSGKEMAVSAPRIVVTSPWKLGLFVFLLVTACGLGLIYLYFGYFGGRLDMTDPQVVRDFYMVCGSVAFLGLLGYLAIVSAAQPADRVAHYSRRRRKLLKKAAGITDPDRVDLEDYQHEPSLAAVLERWREDRRRLSETEAQVFSPQMRERLQAVTRQLEEVRDETNRLAIHAALQLSRLGDEAAPLLQTMEELQEISSRQGKMVVELTAVGGGAELEASGEEPVETPWETEVPATSSASQAPSPDLQPQPSAEPAAEEPKTTTEPAPSAPPGSAWGDLEPTAPLAPSPAATPVDTRQPEEIHDLSEFGAVELETGDPAGGPQERVYDLKEFGAVEL